MTDAALKRNEKILQQFVKLLTNNRGLVYNAQNPIERAQDYNGVLNTCVKIFEKYHGPLQDSYAVFEAAFKGIDPNFGAQPGGVGAIIPPYRPRGGGPYMPPARVSLPLPKDSDNTPAEIVQEPDPVGTRR